MPSPPQETSAEVSCPYCGELQEIYVEPDVEGELVQDCEICCNPWRVRIARRAGALTLELSRLDD